MQMTDFAVKIKKLPYVLSYDALDELAAALTIHIESVVNAEPSVFTDPSEVKKLKIDPEEVVNVRFAQRPFDTI